MNKITIILLSFLLLQITASAQQEKVTIEPVLKKHHSNNIIAIAPLASIFEGRSYGLSFERFLTPNQKFSFYMPILFHRPFNSEPKFYDCGNGPIYGFSVYSGHIGIKYYPFGSQHKVNYATGLLMANYVTHVKNYNTIETYASEPTTVYNAGAVLHNSLNFSVLKRFTLSTELNLGFGGRRPATYNDNGFVYAMTQISIGYRF